MSWLVPIGIGVVVILGLIILGVVAKYFKLWLEAALAQAPVGLFNMVAMSLRGVPPALMVHSRITGVKAGLDVDVGPLEAHYLAGGDVSQVILALIAADKAQLNLTFDRACIIDLATKGTGKTVLEAVRTSINPKVIDCPNPSKGKTTIDAVARDGITVKARAKVTVRTNLEKFVGGATEETVVARVGEGIVTSIGSADSYKEVLENPDRISKVVLEKGLDSGTQFEILSIDIADVDIGENVGAKLQQEQAEADKKVAQAKAEVRRASAVATEQEMKARTQEMQSELIRAQADVPKAMAEALRSGNLGVMDYLKIRNIESDTRMRDTLGTDEDKK